MDLVLSLGFGMAGGAVSALSGYMKNITKETFDFSKFGMTMLRGAAAGFIIGAQEIIPVGIYGGVAGSSVLITFFENLWKSVVNYNGLVKRK